MRPYGECAPSELDRAVISATRRLPDNWLGLRAAIGLRRIVTMRLPPEAGLDVEVWGVRTRLYPHGNICEKTALFTPQMFDAAERAEIARAIDAALAAGRRFAFVDIGANVGLYSLFVASAARGQADIIAVEPEPTSLARMRFNVAANPWATISIAPVALGERRGSVVLDINRENRGGTRARRATEQDTDVVPCMSLLELLESERVERIDALKVDIEGSDGEVLMPFFRDASPSLWPRLIILEDWDGDLRSELASRGYEVVRRTRSNVVLSCRAR